MSRCIPDIKAWIENGRLQVHVDFKSREFVRDERGRFAPVSGGASSLDPYTDNDGDGVTDAARVGVPANQVPPQPPVPRIDNLPPRTAAAQKAFTDAYEKDPDGMATDFRNLVASTTKPGEPKVFGTDDAKALTDVWSNPPAESRAVNRATLNTGLHQTANAIAKRAFVQELDTLKPGDEILVTVGGCGAGKGYALKNVPDALALKQQSKVVWDSAGDQNATENPWIQKEAEARGLKVNYAFVHADPENQWAHPERGVVARANNPEDGRMVDARVFADSYAIGAKNHQAFYDNNKDNPNASFVFLENSGTPKRLDGIPPAALGLDPQKLAIFAAETVKASGAPSHIKEGALQGMDIWSR